MCKNGREVIKLWVYKSSDTLQHYGVLGMKWGIRRYQNKDGSLTPAGKKKAAKLKERYTQLTGKRMRRNPVKSTTSIKTSSKPKRKTVSEMSDAELKARIDRLTLERRFNELSPKQVSRGVAFKKTLSDTAVSVIRNNGQKVIGDYLEKKLRASLGMNTEDPIKNLKKEAETLNLKRQIAMSKAYLESQKPKTTLTRNLIGDVNKLTDQQIDDMIKRLDNEEKLRNKLLKRV